MRSFLYVLSLLIAFGGGFYLSTKVSPAWISADAHRSLDEITEELISHTYFKRSLERSIEQVQRLYKFYPEELTPPQRAQLLAYLEEHEPAMRSEMKSRIKQFLTQKLSRSEMIEINEFYKTQTGQQFINLYNHQDEQRIYRLPIEMMNKEAERIKKSAPATK